jgi:hypothetical protein
MVNQVAAVKAAVVSKTPLSVFDNPQMREYLCKLDPKHSPPYCLERTCILEVMMDAAMKELCENILHGFLYVFDLAFVILKGIYGFKFPKRFLEISSRDLTSSFFLLQLI